MSPSNEDRRWQSAVYATRVAALAEEKAMKRALYIGRPVEWKHGEHVVSGVVVRYAWSADAITVRGDRSGKEYRMSAWRILDAMGLNPAYPR